MSSRDRPRDDDLEERLDELEDVLSRLRADLRASERDGRRRSGSGPSTPRRGRDDDPRRTGPRRTDSPRTPDLPRPPRLSELVRFTEQYTIPTVIALLETTIKSLKLVQGTLRLLDPERDAREVTGGTADRLNDVRDGATEGLARSLSELRTALAEADLPEEAASRSIIEDARDLTAEIESRIEEGRRRADSARDPDRRGRGESDRREGRRGRGESDRREGRWGRDDRDRRDGAVRIDVTDPDTERRDRERDRSTDDGDDANSGTDDEVDDAPEVDVESELDSIKRQLDAVNEENDAGRDSGAADGDSGGADHDSSAVDGDDTNRDPPADRDDGN